MYEYLKGSIKELNPSYVVIETNGVGWFLNISVYTYSKLKEGQETKIFLHHVVREDAEILFGFYDNKERDIFRLLITVNGVGANTARTMLSTLPPDEVVAAIQTDNVSQLKSVKGIGLKTAQRIIVDLRDKITEKTQDADNKIIPQSNTIQNEAFEALVMLGFSKKQIDKALNKVMTQNPDADVETLVKTTLKRL
ncbi:MAG: Holliday junction branch migration protein RuvA [Bacteroidota bacterium]|nr:Holliday junction branch migration protein RuvA [Bacteroidota bacterium]